MTEIVLPEPMDPQALRMAAMAELIAYGPLVSHLDVAGLVMLRNHLRDADIVGICSTGNLAEVRGATLDAVCRGLVAAEYAPVLYFRDVGDLLASAPDDLSGLDDEGPDGGQ